LNLKIVNIIDLYEEIGEEQVTLFLSDFCCPKNHDIEEFLKHKALGFSLQGIAASYISKNMLTLSEFVI
jgi:hypothetical protein